MATKALWTCKSLPDFADWPSSTNYSQFNLCSKNGRDEFYLPAASVARCALSHRSDKEKQKPKEIFERVLAFLKMVSALYIPISQPPKWTAAWNCYNSSWCGAGQQHTQEKEASGEMEPGSWHPWTAPQKSWPKQL